MSEDVRASGSAGFTLVELVSVMAVSLMFSGLIMFFTFQYWRTSATLMNDLETFVSRLNAGDRLRDALNASSGLINQNSIADVHAGLPDPAIATNDYWLPLHAVPGDVVMGSSGTITPVMYFKGPSIDTSANIVLNGVQPYEDEFMLYMDGSAKTLRLRVLANAGAPSNRNKTTCPPSSVSASCPIDRLIAENVSKVSLRYFSKSGNLMDYTSIVDPLTGQYIGPDLPAVEVVELTLHIFKKSTVNGGADTSSQTIIRVALRNG